MSEKQEPAITEAPPPARNNQFDVQHVFWGLDGLRAGWGLALFLIVRELLAICIYPLVMAFPVASRSSGLFRPQGLLVYETAALICVVVATLLMAMLEKRSLSEYGAGTRHRLRYFLAGLGWGLGLLSLLVFALHATGLLAFDGLRLSGRSAFSYGAIWLVGFLVVGLYEESLSRGYLQYTLTRGLRGLYRRAGLPPADTAAFWTAAMITSFGFGFGHVDNTGESPTGLIAAALIGLVFCLSLWRTGSLWWAIGFHTSWDWAQSFLYGVADSGNMAQGRLVGSHPVGSTLLSGGSTGPEGSLLVLPIVALAAIIILVTLPSDRILENQDTP